MAVAITVAVTARKALPLLLLLGRGGCKRGLLKALLGTMLLLLLVLLAACAVGVVLHLSGPQITPDERHYARQRPLNPQRLRPLPQRNGHGLQQHCRG